MFVIRSAFGGISSSVSLMDALTAPLPPSAIIFRIAIALIFASSSYWFEVDVLTPDALSARSAEEGLGVFHEREVRSKPSLLRQQGRRAI